MKKSQLRNIIRESIKELMNEAAPCPSTHKKVYFDYCPGATSQGGSPLTSGNFKCMQIDGQTPGPQHTGTYMQRPPGMANEPNCAPLCTTYKITGIENGVRAGGGVVDFPSVSGCPTSTSAGCDPTAWSNHANWTASWPNSGPFNSASTNQLINQPCTHICNKLQIWNNNLSGAGPVQTNQLNCKIDEGNNQSQIHGCSC